MILENSLGYVDFADSGVCVEWTIVMIDSFTKNGDWVELGAFVEFNKYVTFQGALQKGRNG